MLKKEHHDLLARLQGYNPPDRTVDEDRQTAQDIYDAAIAIRSYRLVVKKLNQKTDDLEARIDGLAADIQAFEPVIDADNLRRHELEEVGWNRFRVLINSLKDSGNDEIAEDLRLLVRFASATHQYLGRTKELDYVCAAFMDLPLGPHGIHF